MAGNGKKRQADPSPEEIRQACEIIQSEWTPEEKLLRQVSMHGYGVTHQDAAEISRWTVPTVRASVPRGSVLA